MPKTPVYEENKAPSGSREERINAINQQIDELCKQREAIMSEEPPAKPA